MLIILLGACSQTQTPAQIPLSPTQKEMVSPDFFGSKPHLEEPRYVGGDSEHLFKEALCEDYWHIPDTAFQCRGSKWNSPRRTPGGLVEDCDGQHNIGNPIALEIVRFLHRFQSKEEKRLKILIGRRCAVHEKYIEAKQSFQKGDQVVVRLEGVSREELKKRLTACLLSNEPIEILENGFSIEDKDLWGESQTLCIRLKK